VADGRVARPVTRHLGRWRPDFLKVHAAEPARYPFLLESASAGTPQGRYDLLLVAGTETLTLDSGGRLHGVASGAGGFLPALDAWFERERIERIVVDELPFHGGWFLYLAYELAAEVEPRLALPAGAGPVAYAARVPAAAIYDHATGEAWLVAEAGAGRVTPAELAVSERGWRRG